VSVHFKSIFVDDIDENNINEIGISGKENIYFIELNSSANQITPSIVDYYCIDSTQNYLEWKSNNLLTRIFKGSSLNSIELYDSTFNNYYIDSVNSSEINFYTIETKDILENNVSSKSKIISIFSHAPGNFNSLEISNAKSIKIDFSLPIDKNSVKLSNFLINNKNPNSVILRSDKSLIIFPNSDLSNGNHKFEFRNIRDIYNTPFQDSTINFSVNIEKNNEILHFTSFHSE